MFQHHVSFKKTEMTFVVEGPECLSGLEVVRIGECIWYAWDNQDLIDKIRSLACMYINYGASA